jgi:hypothetical protein
MSISIHILSELSMIESKYEEYYIAIYMYSLHPQITVAFGFRAVSLTGFVENTCNI